MKSFWIVSALLGIVFVHGNSHSGGHGSSPDWVKMGQDDLKKVLARLQMNKPAKNVILFIGDGIGVNTLTAARIFKAQRDGVPIHKAKLSWEDMPYTGLTATYNTNLQTGDSAGSATALLTGEKSREGVISTDQDLVRGDCANTEGHELKSFITMGIEQGKWGGVVTTTPVADATPATAYAISANRYFQDDGELRKAGITDTSEGCWDIARQFVDAERNRDIRVLLGGGRKSMFPNTTYDPADATLQNRRWDGRNLVQDWKDNITRMGVAPDRVAYVNNKTDFDAIDASKTDYLMGLFNHHNMKYEVDRVAAIKAGEKWTEPSLAEMVKKSIELLSKNDKGYMLMAEGGRIDHAHHRNYAYRALDETVAMDEAVKVAMEMTDEEDTLIVVTSDHSHVFYMAGYPEINNDILGLVHDLEGELVLGEDGLPYTVLGYGNGHNGYKYHRSDLPDGSGVTQRKNLTGVDTTDKDFFPDAHIPLDYETHAGEDVPVYARGPMAHLFVGQHEQSYVAHGIMYAACVGWNKELCEKSTDRKPEPAPCSGAAGQGVGTTLILVCAATLVLLFSKK